MRVCKQRLDSAVVAALVAIAVAVAGCSTASEPTDASSSPSDPASTPFNATVINPPGQDDPAVQGLPTAPPAATTPPTTALSQAAANCPNPATPVRIGGSNDQIPAMVALLRAFNATCPPHPLVYAPSNSTDGMRRFSAGQYPLTITQALPTAQERQDARTRCPGGAAQAVAIDTSVQALAYNLPGVPALRLGPVTLTGILRGSLTRWNAGEIAADNPGVTLPDLPVTVVHRADAAGSTEALSRYLAGGAGDAWDYPATARTWAPPGGRAVSSSAEMAQVVKSTAAAVGYLAWPTARQAGLGAAQVAQGTSWVGPSASAAAVAVSAADREFDDDLHLWRLPYDSENPAAYPMIVLGYALTCSQGLPAEQAEATQGLLRFATSPAGQAALSAAGYLPAP